MADESEKLVAVYIPFKTFQSMISALRSHGLPSKIDRSVWAGRSGADQSGIMGALRFLRLIDEKGDVKDELVRLVEAPENSAAEKVAVRSFLEASYPKVFALNLATATPLQFVEAVGSYNVTGATRDRAVRFFVKAAEHAGVALSKRLLKSLPSAAPRRTNGRVRPPLDEEVDPDSGAKRDGGGDGKGNHITTITLPGVHGSLTISGTFNAFDLAGEERELVYKIVDLMKAFDEAHQSKH